MQNQHTIALVIAVLLSVGTVGTVAAAPGEGPPDNLPGVVPDVVGELLGGISAFVSGILQTVSNLVDGLVPDDAAPSNGVPVH